MKRILLKISGEMLGENGFSAEKIKKLARQISKIRQKSDIEIAIVFGGGNLWRGRDCENFDFPRAESDKIGMTGTFLNAAIFSRTLENFSIEAKIFALQNFPLLSNQHDIAKEKLELKSGKIIIFAGGTGNPFFSTDSAAVLRALEIEAEAVFKITNVSGVFDCDPKKNKKAKKFDQISFSEAIEKKLKVMDQTAFLLAAEYKLPIFVFSGQKIENISEAIFGKVNGTWVR